jgi:hypothetical protein
LSFEKNHSPIKNYFDKKSSGLINHFSSLSAECMQGRSLMSQHCSVDTCLCSHTSRTEGAVYRNIVLQQYLQNMQTSVFVFGKIKQVFVAKKKRMASKRMGTLELCVAEAGMGPVERGSRRQSLR